MLNLRVIITPLICLQHLLIEYLEKDNFMKIAEANSIFAYVKLIIKLSYWQFLCPREIIWVRKTGARYLQSCSK